MSFLSLFFLFSFSKLSDFSEFGTSKFDIPVIGAVFITSCLTLFIYKLISNARPKSNEELLDINTYKTFDSTEISNFDVPNLEESDNLKKENKKNKDKKDIII